MATNFDGLSPLGELLRYAVQNQPWYRRYANTVSALVGAGFSIVGVLAAVGFSDNTYVVAATAILGFLATAFGVKNTRNGWSKSQVETLQDVIVAGVNKQLRETRAKADRHFDTTEFEAVQAYLRGEK